MPLPNVLELLHIVKHHAEPSKSVEPSGQVIILDEYRLKQHQSLEQNVAQATGAPVMSGTTIPPIEQQPQINTQQSSQVMDLLKGPSHEDQAAKNEAIIASTMPESYKKDSVGSRFGEMKNTIDHLAGLDSNRYTTAGKFTGVMQEKAKNQAAILPPAEEMKKAA